MDFFEILQLVGTSLIFVALAPEFIKIAKEKGTATDSLSLGTGALFVVDSLLRLPNVGTGLFAALRNNDAQQIKQLSIAAGGISLVCLNFYGLVVLQGIYNTDRTAETRHDKHVAQILMVVYGICIVAMIAFFVYGISGSFLSSILILAMVVIYGLLVVAGKKGINKVEKKKKIAKILTAVYGIGILCMIVFFYRGIRTALNRTNLGKKTASTSVAVAGAKSLKSK